VTKYSHDKCCPNGLILTLESDENPKEVLKSLFDPAFKRSGHNLKKEGERIV